MALVPNARRSWRWYSMQAGALQVALAGAWLAVPDDLRAAVPSEWLAAGALMLAFLGMLGRLVDQGGGDA